MTVSITEFRNNYKRYFMAALNGELVWIERGGIMYRLYAELPNQKQLPKPNEEEDEEE